jgi:3-oxoacyl-[acyl-carrier-protein] synthase-3
MFNISASGVTLGTAFYAMDDLPDRMTGTGLRPRAQAAVPQASVPLVTRIAGIAALPEGHPALDDTLEALETVARNCLADADIPSDALDLVLFAGVHRTDFVCEPATATRLARLLGLGADSPDRRVFAFDVINGGRGLLDACEIGAAWIAAGEARTVLVATAEIDPNDCLADHPKSGVLPGAGALILRAADGVAGVTLESLRFAQADSTADAARAWCTWDARGAHLIVARTEGWEESLLDACLVLIREQLDANGLALDDIEFLVPPHPSPAFAERLATALGLDPARLVDPWPGGDGDMLTTALPAGLVHARLRGLVRPGSAGLLIAGGAGILAGCALVRG